jgi:hypothetical protein
MGTSEHVNEISGCIQDAEFLDHLIDCQLFKTDTAPCGWLVGYTFRSILIMFDVLVYFTTMILTAEFPIWRRNRQDNDQ